ncbi:MAG TPA: hypothetical protein VJ617_15070 [Arthrobacter sp.]|nr:hypothetical protein [Arthrobacter sp.]
MQHLKQTLSQNQLKELGLGIMISQLVSLAGGGSDLPPNCSTGRLRFSASPTYAAMWTIPFPTWIRVYTTGVSRETRPKLG